jgi:hypothetical protein
MSVLALIIAQAISSAPLKPCDVFAQPATDGQAPVLIANCSGEGFLLGSADSYQVLQNAALRATIVDITQGTERRVLMLSYDNHKPLLEDITGSLALAAGRSAMSGINGLDIDLNAFAQSGTVSVRAAVGDAKPDNAATISLGSQIEAEQARADTTPAEQ